MEPQLDTEQKRVGRPPGSRNKRINIPGMEPRNEYVKDRTGGSARTAARYTERGMPTVFIGVTPCVNPDIADQWFRDGMPPPPDTRRRRRAA